MDKRILDGNALIAQSMGAVFHPEIKLYNNPESMWIFISRPAPSVPLQLGPSQLEYHENWEWLMPVLDKIEQEGWDTTFSYMADKAYHIAEIYGARHEYWRATSRSKIEAVWTVIVKYLESN